MITSAKLQEIAELFNKSKVERKGYILLPTFEGFELFEIDEERLKIYLRSERLYRNNLTNPL